jgi:hypothetical protein
MNENERIDNTKIALVSVCRLPDHDSGGHSFYGQRVIF